MICSDSVEAMNFLRECYVGEQKLQLNLIMGENFHDQEVLDLESKLRYVPREINQSADELEKKAFIGLISLGIGLLAVGNLSKLLAHQS